MNTTIREYKMRELTTKEMDEVSGGVDFGEHDDPYNPHINQGPKEPL